MGELAGVEGIVLHELRRETASLEDAFLALTSSPPVGGITPGARPVRPDLHDEATS